MSIRIEDDLRFEWDSKRTFPIRRSTAFLSKKPLPYFWMKKVY